MRRLLAALTAAFIATFLFVGTAIGAPYVVVLDDSVTNPGATTNDMASKLGFTTTFRYGSAIKAFAADLSSGQLTAVKNNPNVQFVQADATQAATGMAPLASGETVPFGIRRVGGVLGTQGHAASGVNVAVLDTGIDLANADLNAVSGTNCIKAGTAAADDNGHGTNVAGILAARNNGATVVGVAPGTKVYSVKVLGSNRSGTLSQILCGIDWVTNNAAALNIKVANMSIAGAGSNDGNCGNTNNDAEHKAICRSVAAGVTYAAGAGNNAGKLGLYVPAAYPEVLTVTGMSDSDGVAGGTGPVPACKKGEKDDTYASFSNFATTAADQAHVIAAPATCVVSDGKGGGTSTYYGTSQASPHAAGAAALCINDGGVAGACLNLTPAQIVSRMISDAKGVATASNAFAGDPLRPVTGKYFGYLIRADLY